MKNFVIACGGTGGHLSPGVAVAEQLMKEGCRCTLIISDKNIDRLMLRKYPNITYAVIHARPFSKNLIKFAYFFFSQIKALFFAVRFLSKHKIDCVIGFGGFTNVPFALAGFLLRKKIFLHESNRIIGKSIRMLSYFADTVYLPQGVNFRSRYLNKKVKHIGYPLRKEFVVLDKIDARKSLKISSENCLILVIGGSQGAKILTNWAIENCKILNEHGISVYCITGGMEREFNGNVFKRFSDDMCLLYNACDIVVARAGAGTIAEASFFNKPMILIPYPHAAGDHQTKNAQYVASIGRGDWLPEKQIDSLTKLVINRLDAHDPGVGHVYENPVIEIVKDVTK